MQNGLVGVSQEEASVLREAMRDIQAAVAGYYAQTAQGGDLGTAVRSFLVSTQTLNEQLLQNIANKASYNAIYSASSHSGADYVKAVKYARNVQQHVLHIVRPNDDMTLVGGVHGLRTYAFWDEIPQTAHDKLHDGTKRLKPKYDAMLVGQEVTQTMLEVLNFYSEVAPEIVHRDANGEWSYFPLMNQPAMLSPRLHPEEPKDLTEAQAWLNGRLPNGDARVVSGQVSLDGVQWVVGLTFVGTYSFGPFVEAADQVNSDIAKGFSYLEGEAANNIRDVSASFQHAQGAVIQSAAPLESWASPIGSIQAKEDWSNLFDIAECQHLIRIEADKAIPEGVTYELRRARRLNAFVSKGD